MACQVFAHPPEATLSSYMVYTGLSPSMTVSDDFSGRWRTSTVLLVDWHRRQAEMHSINSFFLSLCFVDSHS